MSFFVQPDLRKWEKMSRKLYFDDCTIEVAPEDLSRPDGSHYFDYEQARKAAEMVGNGWRLATPVEMALILATTAFFELGVESFDAELMIKTFGFDFNGYGVSVSSGEKFVHQYVGEQGNYWLDGMVDRSRCTVNFESAYALQLMAITNSANLTSIEVERGAAVRLIRVLTD